MMSSFGKVLLAGVLGLSPLASVSAQEMIAPSGVVRAEGSLQTLTTPQFTRLNQKGAFLGSIAKASRDGALRGVPNLKVSIISGEQIVSRVMTNAEGDFSVPQLRPGYYTIVASNPTDLLVFPITIAPSDGTEVEPSLLVAASPVSPGRREAMMAAIFGIPMQGFTVPAPLSVPQRRETSGTYEIAVTPNGELVGRIGVAGASTSQIDMSSMVVRVTREDSIVGEAQVNPDGTFSVRGVTPGPVAFFAFGPQGFVAVGLKLVSGGFSAKKVQGDEILVSMLAGAPGLNIEVAPLGSVIAGAGIPGDSFSGPVGNPLGPPAGGFGVGGVGGGFGGGGAGGGLGADGLMGLGIAALAAVALLDDDDNNFVPAPISPAFP